jgi:hypothetical protein
MDTPDATKLHAIKTKDGITITDIPDSVPDNSTELAQRVATLRASRKGSDPVSVSYTSQPQMSAWATASPAGAAPSILTGGTPGDGKTDIGGVLGAVERPLIPTTVGAAIGSVAGPEGALAGAGIASAVFGAGDLLVPLINKMFGTTYSTPTDALNHYLTKAGIAIPDSEFERIVQAAATGAAGAVGSMGAGQVLKGASGAVEGAQSTAQGVGKALMEAPASQVAGGAAAGAASEGAAAAGAGPIPQMAAGIAGGFVGSRLAPGRPALTTPSAPRVQTAEKAASEIGTLVRKASSPSLGRAAAREKLVALADINPEAKAAADRLGFDLPADVFADNPQVRAAAGLTRSVAGSETESAWRASVQNALDRADDVIRQYDATFVEGSAAPGVVSQRVRDSLTKTREALSKEAADLYAQVDQAVPKQTPVKLDNLRSTLDGIASEVGEDGLSSQEKALRKMLDQGPTYGRLLREKNLIGQALSRKESPYGNMEAGSLKRLYGALAEDQLANVDAAGKAAAPGLQTSAAPGAASGTTLSEASSPAGISSLGEKLRTANLLYAKERALGDRIVDVFGSDVEGSIANRMRSAVVSASKGDGEQFGKLMDLVPEDLRRETVATSLASVARNRRGEFGFAEYANTYRGLRANPEVYSKIVKTLGDGSDGVLRDLYEVSKRITDARANVLVTGKANQALLSSMSAENVVAKVLKSTIVRGATTAGTVALGGGPIGAGAANIITSAIAGGDRDALKAAGKLFASAKFQTLVEAAARGRMPNLDTIRETARSSAFANFARAVKLPFATQQREMWILSALSNSAEEGVKQ